ncbi:MAG: nuclear pore complex subunit [Bacteroidetes bacterium]|nr:MAG: nuclear pore complex subunit [Bacteroidota bacterium]
MDALTIKQQNNTIGIVLDKGNKKFVFEGRSLPENTVKFFEPVMKWIEEYKKEPLDQTDIDLNFIYFNTSSAKIILEVLQEFDQIHREGKNVKITWHFMEDDYDIKEAGEEYESMVSVPFEYVEHPEEDYE